MTKIKKEVVETKGIPYKDFFKQMKEEEEWKKEHPLLSFPGAVKDFFIYTIPGRFSDTKFELGKAWQRAVRGYDDSMVWNHHSWHSEYTAKMLRQLAAEKHGCPGNLWDGKKKDDECHKWKKTLIEIAEGFEAATAIDDMDWFTEDKNGEYDKKVSEKKRAVLEKKFDKGMKLYVEYYQNLWD